MALKKSILLLLGFLTACYTLPNLQDYRRIVEDPMDQRILLKNHESEKQRFGLAQHILYYKHKASANTVLEQRSGRKRLYDHNLILREIFQNRIIHHEFGNLGDLFRGAVFMDFGSAILYNEGAPTVRDIYEDHNLLPHLSQIVATDINDPTYNHTRYIEIYRNEREPFPFSVSQIDPALTSPEQISQLLAPFVQDEYTPVIYRSTNSGPDLFYTLTEIQDHFASIIRGNPNRNILYFFNRYVFFRSACHSSFQYIGTIDEKVGVNHSWSAWKFVDWNSRTISEAFTPNYRYLYLMKADRLPIADQTEKMLRVKGCMFAIKSDRAKKDFVKLQIKPIQQNIEKIIRPFFDTDPITTQQIGK